MYGTHLPPRTYTASFSIRSSSLPVWAQPTPHNYQCCQLVIIGTKFRIFDATLGYYDFPPQPEFSMKTMCSTFIDEIALCVSSINSDMCRRIIVRNYIIVQALRGNAGSHDKCRADYQRQLALTLLDCGRSTSLPQASVCR